jgi:hypothetical protein
MKTMKHYNHWFCCVRRVVMLIIAILQLSACQQKSETPAHQIDLTPKIEYTGQALHRVRLTAKRAEELGIKTVPVREEKIAGNLRKVVPSAAVLYDKDGNAWMFKSPDSLVFVRERLSVESINGDLAILADGPSVGTPVVTAGANTLFSDELRESRAEMTESKTTESGKAKQPVGTATMKEDGTIRVVYKTEGRTGLGASIVVEYKPTDEEYQKILDQVGGLKVGETKAVPNSL